MILFPDETADSLYAGVLDHPGDDLRRLILADRMEEIGQAEWAEFIRMDCCIDVSTLNDPTAHDGSGTWEQCSCEWCRAIKRRRDLWDRHKCEWFGERWAILLLDWHEPGIVAGVSFDLPEAVIRRGFPAEVHAPLAWLLGGECERCEGFGTITSENGNDWACPICQESGRTPGHLAGLVRTWPIERAVVTDKEPGQVRYPEGRTQFAWSWPRDDDPEATRGPSHTLPARVHRYIRGVNGLLQYPTSDAAIAALSDAVLKVAKEGR